MKNCKFKLLLIGAVLSLSVTVSSCGPKDNDIQNSFNEKTRTDARLGNISGTVKDGVLTLNGQCPDENCRSYAEQSAKEVKGVKSVVNNISVTPPVTAAPVEITPDTALETGV